MDYQNNDQSQNNQPQDVQSQNNQQQNIQPQNYQQNTQPQNNQPPYNRPSYNQQTYNQSPYNNNYQQPISPVSEPGKGFAVASLVLGIVSFFCFGLVTGVLAVIFGAVAKSKGYAGGMATAGIVLGVIGIVIMIVSWIFLGASLSTIPWDSLT